MVYGADWLPDGIMVLDVISVPSWKTLYCLLAKSNWKSRSCQKSSFANVAVVLSDVSDALVLIKSFSIGSVFQAVPASLPTPYDLW